MARRGCTANSNNSHIETGNAGSSQACGRGREGTCAQRETYMLYAAPQDSHIKHTSSGAPPKLGG
eukprot:14670832-Alexandrium_andersonii.AAC.1